jgi:hypothetical protein
MLSTLLVGLPARYAPPHASDWTVWVDMAAPPSALGLLLDLLPARIAVHAVDHVLQASLAYPGAWLGDTTPPVISNVQISRISGLVKWETDEFADSQVWYGSTPGSYTGVVSRTLWTTEHGLLVPDPGSAQVILIRSADRSGNVAEYYDPGYSLSGSVEDEGGAPIPDVLLSAGATLVTRSGPDGSYALRGVPPGEYVLTAWHSEYSFTPEQIAITVAGDQSGLDFVGRLQGRSCYIPLVLK